MRKFDKILIGIAFSPNLKPNLFEAVRLANMFNAELVGVHVGEASEEKKENLNSLLSEADVLHKPIPSDAQQKQKTRFGEVWGSRK